MLANVPTDEAEAVISLGTKIQRLQRGLLILLDLIHRAAEKGSSRKPALIRPHTYTVPGRRRAGLISELPRRVLLGN